MASVVALQGLGGNPTWKRPETDTKPTWKRPCGGWGSAWWHIVGLWVAPYGRVGRGERRLRGSPLTPALSHGRRRGGGSGAVVGLGRGSSWLRAHGASI